MTRSSSAASTRQWAKRRGSRGPSVLLPALASSLIAIHDCRSKSSDPVTFAGELAQLRLSLRTSMRATQDALHAGVAEDAWVRRERPVGRVDEQGSARSAAFTSTGVPGRPGSRALECPVGEDGPVSARDLVTILGNLIDNALRLLPRNDAIELAHHHQHVEAASCFGKGFEGIPGDSSAGATGRSGSRAARGRPWRVPAGRRPRRPARGSPGRRRPPQPRAR